MYARAPASCLPARGQVVSSFGRDGNPLLLFDAGNAAGTLYSSGISCFGLAIDPLGNVIACCGSRIVKVQPHGVMITLAGSSNDGYADGAGNSASFYSPYGVAVDAGGNVIVADTGNHRIRKVTPGGVVTTLAGRWHGFVDELTDGIGADASFNVPLSVAVDASGNVIVADSGNSRIRKVTPGGRCDHSCNCYLSSIRGT